MPSAIDYRDSHKTPGKGPAYDSDFRDLKYRKYIWSWEQQVLRGILERFFADRGHIDYLDFACGTGRIVTLLENHVTRSYGVDVSDSMLHVARQRIKKTKLIKTDITQGEMGTVDGQNFDLITAFRFFLNAQEDLRQQVMIALARLLKKGGYLVLNVHMNQSCTLAKLVRTKRRLLRLDPWGFNTLSYEEIERLLASCGLKIIHTYHRGIVPIVNENTRIPMWSIHPLETLASHVTVMRSWSRFVVYVCQLPSETCQETSESTS